MTNGGQKSPKLKSIEQSEENKVKELIISPSGGGIKGGGKRTL